MKHQFRPTYYHQFQLLAAALGITLGLSGIASAESIPLALSWQKNSESDLAGYHVYQKIDSKFTQISVSVDGSMTFIVPVSTNKVDVEPVINRLDEKPDFAVTAFDTSDNESGLSTPAVYSQEAIDLISGVVSPHPPVGVVVSPR